MDTVFGIIVGALIITAAAAVGTWVTMLFAGALLASLGVVTLGFWQIFWVQALLGSAGVGIGAATKAGN